MRAYSSCSYFTHTVIEPNIPYGAKKKGQKKFKQVEVMDTNDNGSANGGSKSALRQPFIDTANALAFFYKQAVQSERDARDAGSRQAYRRILEWAARKSRAGDKVTCADIIGLCARELAAIPPRPRSPEGNDDAGDGGLTENIRKLVVNPRKRQRRDISDDFVSACRAQEESDDSHDVQWGSRGLMNRLEDVGRNAGKDAWDNARENAFGGVAGGGFSVGDWTTKKGKLAKGGYDKHKKK